MSQFRFPMPSQDRVVIIVSLLVVLGIVGVGGLRFNQILQASGTTLGQMVRTSQLFAWSLAGMVALLLVWLAYAAGVLAQSSGTALDVADGTLLFVRPRLLGIPGTGRSTRLALDDELIIRVRQEVSGLRRGWWLVAERRLQSIRVCLDLAVSGQVEGQPIAIRSAADVLQHPLIIAMESAGAPEVKVE